MKTRYTQKKYGSLSTTIILDNIKFLMTRTLDGKINAITDTQITDNQFNRARDMAKDIFEHMDIELSRIMQQY